MARSGTARINFCVLEPLVALSNTLNAEVARRVRDEFAEAKDEAGRVLHRLTPLQMRILYDQGQSRYEDFNIRAGIAQRLGEQPNAIGKAVTEMVALGLLTENHAYSARNKFLDLTKLGDQVYRKYEEKRHGILRILVGPYAAMLSSDQMKQELLKILTTVQIEIRGRDKML